jgi:pimeloyl-ACP methyl ester carboxylesterase
MPSWKLDPDRYRPRVNGDGQLVIFLNGILTAPGDQFAWTDRAERWFARNTPHDFDSFEYWHTAVLSRLFAEARQVAEAAELVANYLRAWRPVRPRLHLVAHSRGCELARRLVVERRLEVASLHLFAAAIDADFETNGLNTALRTGTVERLSLYTSRGDGVLRWIAGASLGLYGRLGYTGPRRADPNAPIRIIERETFGHSDWFAPAHFDASMRLIATDLDELP